MDELQNELPNPPRDGITAVRFSDAHTLLVSSWDSTLRLYDLCAGGATHAKLLQPTAATTVVDYAS